MIAEDTLNAISSAVSQDGQLLLPLQVGLPINPSGPGAVHANPLALPDVEKAQMMSAISGPLSIPSSASADLQRSLESRLRQLTEGCGSPLYALTWKHWDMPLGLPICALRASARRTSDSDSTGWPTPISSRGDYQNGHNGRKNLKLPGVAKLTGWPTPRARDGDKGARTQFGAEQEAQRKGWNNELGVTAFATGWPTPMAQEARLGYQRRDNGKKGTQESLTTVVVNSVGMKPHLPEHTVIRVDHLGQTLISYSAATESGGQLNPELARWLMGFPVGWSSYAVTATRSTRTKQRCS